MYDGMDRTDLVDGLEAAGLSEYEAAVYLTLLEHGTTAAVDVARRSSVPTPRIYDILETLEGEGYVETLDRERLHARPRDPVDVLDSIRDRSELLSDLAGEIEDRWERAPIGEHSLNMTKRAETVYDHAQRLIREADKSVDLALMDEQLDEVEAALRDVDFGDVVVRISIWSGEDDGGIDPDHPVRAVATEIRERKIPTPFTAIIDRSTVCFAPTARMPDPYGLVVRDEFIALVFSWYFQAYNWSGWETIHRQSRYGVEYVTLQEFVLDVFAVWWNGAMIALTIEGIDTETGEDRTISGRLADIHYTNRTIEDPIPTLGDLAGLFCIEVDTGDGRYTVGSWAAILEDIEARWISMDAIVLPPELEGSGSARTIQSL